MWTLQGAYYPFLSYCTCERMTKHVNAKGHVWVEYDLLLPVCVWWYEY